MPRVAREWISQESGRGWYSGSVSRGPWIVLALSAMVLGAPVARAQDPQAPPPSDTPPPTDAPVPDTATAPITAPDEGPDSLRLAEARAQFTAGRAAFDAGAWEPALAAFERAHALTGSPELLYNIAVASERLGRLDRAVERYEAYVRALPEASDRAEVDERIRRLREELGARQRARAAAEQAERERAARRTAAARRDRERDDVDRGGVLSKWWFWAAVGTVAAAATVGTVLVLGDDAPAPILGTNGVVHTALTVSP